jgi:hypothetical protein
MYSPWNGYLRDKLSRQHFSRDCQEGCQGLDRDHKKHWESLTGLKHAKGFLQEPSAWGSKELLKLNRNQLWWVTGLLTGHCHLEGHLLKMGLTYSAIFERCLEEDESATHILCDCEAIAYLRFRHLGHYFMERDDYQDAPIRVSNILYCNLFEV